MKKSNVSEVEFQLKKLLSLYSDLFDYHQWPSEHERWVELVFALTVRVSDKVQSEIRTAIGVLDDSELLGIEELSTIPKTVDGVDLNYPHARRIAEILEESGFTIEESRNSILAMKEAAESLIKHNDGKIQKYLRKYGQRMVDELTDHFSFSKLSKADIKLAFTYWLQNVLNMPITLKTKVIDHFCKQIKCTEEDIIKEADTLNINVALVDDLILQYITDQEEKDIK